jgi:Skp family chaperone for outer membrane proteins
MTTEKFKADLALARTELAAATADAMAFVRAGRAFGEHWKAAVEREREAHKRMQRVLNSPLVSSVGEKQEP